MADETVQATRAEQIVMTALSTIDFSKMENVDKLETTLLQRISTVEKFLNPKSVSMRMMDCVRIPAVIDKIDYEESSTRFVITYRPDKVLEGQDDTEQVRSDRTDSEWYGQKVKDLWNGLEGKHVIIYKTNEETGNKQKPTVRIAPYVKVLPAKK